MLTEGIEYISPQAIIVVRDDRQRQDIDVEDLLPSIQKLGILNPIIITANGVLIAGERRLTAALQLKLPIVPVRRAASLTPLEARLVELDENLRREELPWQDRVKAMSNMLALMREDNTELTVKEFSEFIGYNLAHVHKCLLAADELAKGNERVASAQTMTKAINVVTRENERVTNNALADIIDTLATPNTEMPPLEDPAESPVPKVVPVEKSILVENFHSWAQSYTGQKFNLIHCDFPYGIDIQDSDQAGSSTRVMYEDSADVYWELLETLARNQQRFVSSSAHIIFWFSMEFYAKTLSFFEEFMPDWTFEKFPLVWHKTDNKGIASDVERRPRRVYETALFGWRGDRKLVKLGSNAYGAPKANSSHVSEKPEPVLRQFFSMVCDSHTRLFDPTCGSGSALRAAESLGASRVLGLELDPSHAEDARSKLRQFRSLRSLSQ